MNSKGTCKTKKVMLVVIVHISPMLKWDSGEKLTIIWEGKKCVLEGGHLMATLKLLMP